MDGFSRRSSTRLRRLEVACIEGGRRGGEESARTTGGAGEWGGWDVMTSIYIVFRLEFAVLT